MIAPKKSLGQNFLIDKNISRKIVESLSALAGDEVLEIGPGTGALTEALVAEGYSVTAVEIDKRAVEELNRKFRSAPNLRIINDDFTNFNIDEAFPQGNRIKVIGNIPYYLTSEILFKLFESAARTERAVLMMQKEVAQRLYAAPRTKEYGILSVALGLCAAPRKLFDVSPACFFPRPKVTSTVIALDFFSPDENKFDPQIMRLVRKAFNTRRKTLRNALSGYVDFELVDDRAAAFASKRAEELTVEDFLALYKSIKQKSQLPD